MNKKYWLRGLLTGVAIYVISVVFTYILALGDEWGPSFAAMIIGIYASPVIIFGLLIGWIWGRVKQPSMVQ